MEEGWCSTPSTSDFGKKKVENKKLRNLKRRWDCFRVTSEARLSGKDPSENEIFVFCCCEVCVLLAEKF